MGIIHLSSDIGDKLRTAIKIIIKEGMNPGADALPALSALIDSAASLGAHCGLPIEELIRTFEHSARDIYKRRGL